MDCRRSRYLEVPGTGGEFDSGARQVVARGRVQEPSSPHAEASGSHATAPRRKAALTAPRADHRSLSLVGADRCSEPLHSFLICSLVREYVARTSEGEHSVALYLSPNLNTLAGAPSGETKDEQQPRN